MNFTKQIFILALSCFFIILLQSCSKDNLNNETTNISALEDQSEITINNRSLLCCDDVSFTVSSVPHSVVEGCCDVFVDLNDPNGCTDGTGIVYYPEVNASIPTTYPLSLMVCPDFGAVQFFLNDCDATASTSSSDCDEVNCCETTEIEVIQTQMNESCCHVTFQWTGCPDGYFFQEKGLAAMPLSGVHYQVQLCDDDTEVRVFNMGCKKGTDWIKRDCF